MSETMHSTLNSWLEELEVETQIVTSEKIDDEANGNMVSFGFNADLLNEWGKDSIHDFLISCSMLYGRKGSDLKMIFYSWFDEQAGQIRISSVRENHGRLPFECNTNSVNLNELVNGFYSDDSGLYSKGELDVWQKSI